MPSSYNDSSAKLLSVQNNGSEKFALDKDGVITTDSIKAVGAFSARASVNQADIPDSIGTAVNFDTEEFDTNGWYDPSTSAYCPTQAGYYRFNSLVYIFPGVDNKFASIRLNEKDTPAGSYNQIKFMAFSQTNAFTDGVMPSGTVTAYNDGDDCFKIYFVHNFGVGTSDISTSSTHATFFQGEYIGR